MDDDDWEDLELDHAPEQYETTPGSQAAIPGGGPPDPTAVVGDSEVKPEGADTAEDGDDDNLSDGLADEPICRICLSGEDERDLGRLISPCLCRGTVAKVHVACLNRWRNRSPSSTSYFQCDQCKYRYRIKRAKIAGLAENKYALAGLTILAFVFLVFINGYIGNWILKQSTTDSFASLIFYTEPSDAGYHWHPSGTYLPLETVGQAVELASNLAEELRYTQDGGEEGGGSSDDSSLRPANDVAKNDEAEQTEASDSETSYRYVRPKMRRRNIRKKMVKRFRSIVSHFAVGVSFTGIGSFLWLLLTLPLWPFHPMRAGLFRTFRGREGRGAASPLGSVLLALFVVVGLVKSLHLCWKLTRKGAHFVLRRAENGILEVG